MWQAEFKGLFVDANAISPMRSQEIGSQMALAGVEYVDGGIIGAPKLDLSLSLWAPI